MKPRVCVDFDGVLNNYRYFDKDNLFKPRPGAKEFLERLSQDYIVIIFTARDTSKVKEWLDLYEFKYDKVTNVKEGAMAYIDDRAIHFDGNYKRTLHTLDSFKTYWEL